MEVQRITERITDRAVCRAAPGFPGSANHLKQYLTDPV